MHVLAGERFLKRLSSVVPHSRRDLRLASGLVLFVYVAVHLFCHALGLVSVRVAEEALRITVLFWHSLPGTLLLYSATGIHVSLALLAVYDRRTLRMPPVQGIRIVLGLAMPIGLIGHFFVTRYAFERFGLPAEYSRVAAGLWEKGASGLALGLLAPGWIHGCLGLRFAFGHRVTSQRIKLAVFGAALLLPVLAAVGFVSMGRELAASPAERSAAIRREDPGQEAQLGESRDDARMVYLALLLLIVLGRLARTLNERRLKSVIWISYPGRTVSVPRGWTVLEASRSFGVPHQAQCGGRARCTTCRVRVVAGSSHCPDPQTDEARALNRLASSRGTIRLACQLRPTGDVEVEPILSASLAGRLVAPAAGDATEFEAVVLLLNICIDTDGSVQDSASAHDTIYALGRFLAIAEAAAGPHTEIFRHSASSWLLVFRAGKNSSSAFDIAASASRKIDAGSKSLCAVLSSELGLRARSSVTMHAGRVVVGTIGAGTKTVVGGPVDDLEHVRRTLPSRSRRATR